MAYGGSIGAIQLDDPIKIEDQYTSTSAAQVKKAFSGAYVMSSIVRTSLEGRYKLKLYWVSQSQLESIRALINAGTSFIVTSHSAVGVAATTITNARGIPGTDKFTAVADGDFFTGDFVRSGTLDLYNGEIDVVGLLVNPA